MSYPSGAPGGYPGQPPAPAGPNFIAKIGLPKLLSAATLLLALVCYFISFADAAAGTSLAILLLLAGGLLGVFALLPKAPNLLPTSALLSTLGGLHLLAIVVHGGATTFDGTSFGGSSSTAGSVIVILIFGLLQFLVAIAALVLDSGVINLAPKPAPYGHQQGGWPQQPQQGQYPQAQTPQQYGQTPPSTQYVGQGQPAAAQPSAEYGQPAAQQYGHPGTPPGGFPQG
jgi:hypothetical protein